MAEDLTNPWERGCGGKQKDVVLFDFQETKRPLGKKFIPPVGGYDKK